MKMAILKAMNAQTQISLRIVRGTYPDYNVKRTKKLKTLRDNEEIIETKLRFIAKNENYFRNNEPLQEDFFILKGGDGGAEAERETTENDGDLGNNSGNKTTMNVKKKEDKNSD